LKGLEDIGVPFELRVVVIWLYERDIAKFRSNHVWSEKIKCNIGVKQGCPFPSILFGFYIHKLEDFLEEVGSVSTDLICLVIILFFCVEDIFLLVRNPKILQDLFTNSEMTMDTIDFPTRSICHVEIPIPTPRYLVI
jgi:hypothetical protein